jgi:DNA-binding transcriptional regulator YiaG
MATMTAPPRSWTKERIRALRERLGYTQAQMAEALGYELARSISDLESGRREPSGAVRVLLDLLNEHGDLKNLRG